MVSDSELVGRLREFLSTSDLDTTTTASVRRKLEEDFGIDLSDRKLFIREQIDIYLQSQGEAQENEENEGGEAEVEEEENEEAAEDSGGTDEGEAESGNGNSAAKRRLVNI